MQCRVGRPQLSSEILILTLKLFKKVPLLFENYRYFLKTTVIFWKLTLFWLENRIGFFPFIFIQENLLIAFNLINGTLNNLSVVFSVILDFTHNTFEFDCFSLTKTTKKTFLQYKPNKKRIRRRNDIVLVVLVLEFLFLYWQVY